VKTVSTSADLTLGPAGPRVRSRGALLGGFWLRLGVIAAIGVTLRVLYTTLVAPWPPKVLTDEFYYNVIPHALDQGRGFLLPFGIHGQSMPTAQHPPFYPLVLAALGELGGTGQEAQRLAGSLFGLGTILAVALLARRLAGDRVGLVAAGIAAVYPTLIAADGALMSESLYGLLVALSLLSAYRLLESRSLGRAIVLGGLVGLAALTRAEAVLLLPLVLIPIVRHPLGKRAAVTAILVMVAVIAPWTVRNWEVFHRFVPLATDSGSAIAGANCPSVYSGPNIGSWNIFCVKDYHGNEAITTARMRTDGARYALHHVDRLPAVVAARELRVWSLYQPLQQHSEGRSIKVEHLGLAMYYVLVALAIYAIPRLRRLRQPVWVLLTPIVMVSITAALIFGNVRFREPAEVSLVILAALGGERLLTRLRARLRPSASPAAG
jgi:4-amino-4-deoxy-L-arabinose transferase-like glycosyltransferase